jgi:hypothetical protein
MFCYFTVNALSGLSTGIYATNSPEMCHLIASAAECNIIVVENNHQLKKILQIWDRLPLLRAVVQYKGEPQTDARNVYSVSVLLVGDLYHVIFVMCCVLLVGDLYHVIFVMCCVLLVGDLYHVIFVMCCVITAIRLTHVIYTPLQVLCASDIFLDKIASVMLLLGDDNNI